MARTVTQEIYKLSSQGPFSKDFGLKDQMRRSAVSIMSNIAEGFDRGGNREFLQFLALAKGSAGELESQLFVAFDQQYISSTQFQNLRASVLQTKRLIGGLMSYLHQSDKKGSKFNSQRHTVVAKEHSK